MESKLFLLRDQTLLPFQSYCEPKIPVGIFCMPYLKVVQYDVDRPFIVVERTLCSGHDVLNTHFCSQVVPYVIAFTLHVIRTVSVVRITYSFSYMFDVFKQIQASKTLFQRRKTQRQRVASVKHTGVCFCARALTYVEPSKSDVMIYWTCIKFFTAWNISDSKQKQ